MRRLEDLERRLRSLETSPRLANSSIIDGTLSVTGDGGINVQATDGIVLEEEASFRIKDGGTLRADDRDGSSVFYVGPLGEEGQYKPMSVLISRADSTAAFAVYGSTDTQQYVAMYDAEGHVICGDDILTGRGLARPYIPVSFTESVYPTRTTVSETFEELFTASFYWQHPQLLVYIYVRASDATTSGEVRAMYSDGGLGVQIGSTAICSLGEYVSRSLGPAPLPGDYSEFVEVTIQARRTAGAGTIGVRVVSAYGMQS